MATNYNFNSSAVENTILNLLLASEKSYEYPSLQTEAVGVISNNISKVVYESLKQKSVSSSTKRCNILKFLNNICQAKEYHVDANTYKIYLNAYEKEFGNNNPIIQNFLHENNQELGEFSTDLNYNVVEFYKRKNKLRKQRTNKLELLKQKDQEILHSKLGIQIPRNTSHYETSESLINDLLLNNNCTAINNNKSKPVHSSQDSREYKEKQIKFCYALMNFADKKDMEILKNILQKLSLCRNLEPFEIGFIMDLWLSGDQPHLDVTNTIVEDFPFVVEKTIIQFCTEIVKLKNAAEVSRYFVNLEENPKILRLRSACLRNIGVYCKMKSLIFELYVYSYCNVNVYRFIDYII